MKNDKKHFKITDKVQEISDNLIQKKEAACAEIKNIEALLLSKNVEIEAEVGLRCCLSLKAWERDLIDEQFSESIHAEEFLVWMKDGSGEVSKLRYQRRITTEEGCTCLRGYLDGITEDRPVLECAPDIILAAKRALPSLLSKIEETVEYLCSPQA